MNNDSLKRIQKLTKEKITVSNFQKDSIMNNRYNNKKQFNLLKTTIAACICIIFTSGLVFAKDIETFIKERREGDIDACYASIEYAKEKLGFEAKYNIEDMCLDAYNFVKTNKNN